MFSANDHDAMLTSSGLLTSTMITLVVVLGAVAP